MKHSYVYTILKSSIACIFLVFGIEQNACLSQSTNTIPKGYAKATYNLSGAGKFMQNWLIAGPIPVKMDITAPSDFMQEKVFKTDILSNVNIIEGKAIPPVSVNNKDFGWQLVSTADDIVDLYSIYKKADFAYAYAVAEIKASAPADVLLAVGSNDAIKVWLNGKMVHQNQITRGIIKDNDLVPLRLTKGSNQLLLKVQDIKGAWGFVTRILDKSALTEQLTIAAANGNIDHINLLINGGADVNAISENGISPVMIAKVKGRDDVLQLLFKKGATDKEVPPAETLADHFYNSLKGKESPGIALLAAKDGKVLYRKGFGYADIKNKILITPDTKFRIGSVTKQFTAAAILKLKENNLLSVNDKLSKFIPDFPRGDEVTIHQLLTHTSGIHSYTNNEDFLNKVTKTISPDSLINLIKKEPYDFKPGEKMIYNNSGYFILGFIISKVSGKKYADYLKENFFDLLGMKNTGIYYAGIKLEHKAKGYTKKNDKYEEALNWDMSWAGGAGAIYSTVDDLLKWNQALYGGKVLTERSMSAVLTPAVLSTKENPSMQYGYGLMFSKFRGEDIIGHSGGLNGFITQLVYFPKEKFTVVMFSNTAEPAVNFDPNKIAEAFLWNKMEKQITDTEMTAKPKDLQIFTGRYQLKNVGLLNISTEDNKLYAQITGQSKYEIFPKSEDEFFWKIVEARLKFSKNEKGEIKQATLFQNGQQLTAKKIHEEHIIDINPAIRDKYTGKYRMNKDLVITIFKENNKLFAQATGQPKIEMAPTSETDFVLKEINAKLFFTMDEKGKVIKLKLNLNGSDNNLPKIE